MMETNYNDIDLELEKIIFLINANEENLGIYELVWELSYYNLPIEDKYNIAHIVLKDIVNNGLVTLEKYSDVSHKIKICTIPIDKTEETLNNPKSWYPEDQIIAITLTDKGEKYLKDHRYHDKQKFIKRFYNKKK